MPLNMLLKSEGFASNLYAPGGGYPSVSFDANETFSTKM